MLKGFPGWRRTPKRHARGNSITKESVRLGENPEAADCDGEFMKMDMYSNTKDSPTVLIYTPEYSGVPGRSRST